MVTQQKPYLTANEAALAQLKKEAEETDYWAKYNSLKRFLECQEVYYKSFEDGGDPVKSAAAHWNAWVHQLERQEKVDFSDLIFSDEVDFRGIEFPVDVDFSGCIFEGDANFTGCKFLIKSKFNSSKFNRRAIFNNCIFNDVEFDRSEFFMDSEFSYCHFGGRSSFRSCKFHDVNCIFEHSVFESVTYFSLSLFKVGALFSSSEFCDSVFFGHCKFLNSVSFLSSKFHALAHFSQSEFQGAASFSGCKFYILEFNHVKINLESHFDKCIFSSSSTFRFSCFKGSAYFDYSSFCDTSDFEGSFFFGVSSFRMAHFKKGVSFSGCQFRRESNFSGICADRSFSLLGVSFQKVPDFTEAILNVPPVLDGVKIPNQLSAMCGLFDCFYCVPEPEKRERQCVQRFRALGKLAHEARDWGNEMEFFAQEVRCRRFSEDFPTGPNAGRFWFGLFYEKLSNFGRSFARPLVAWIISLMGFALLYCWLATGGSWWDAFAVSWRQGLVISGLVRTGHYQTLLQRLFDATPDDGVVDVGNVIFFLLSLQTLLSAFLLFLFFLAVRNHFRIR